MKTQLTKEQSKHLIELGVPKEKAGIKHIELTLEEYRVFSLTDLLSILPNNIGDRNRIVESGERGHFAYYCGANGSIGWKPAKAELIDSLYELCVWCIEYGYLKF